MIRVITDQKDACYAFSPIKAVYPADSFHAVGVDLRAGVIFHG